MDLKSSPRTGDPSLSVSKSLSEHHAQLTQQLSAYYDRTKLLAVVEGYMGTLTQHFAARRLVPLNPYVSLLSYVRQAEISATELLVAPRPRDLKTFASQEVLLFDARDGRPALALEHQAATFKTGIAPVPDIAVWARRSVIERIPYSREWQDAADEVYSLVSPWLRESEGADESCGLLSVGAMIGPKAFFLGVHLPCPHQLHQAAMFVEVERHVIVFGDQLELAMAVFARQQIRALYEATKKQATIPLPDGGQLSLVGPCAIKVSPRGYGGGGRERVQDDSTWTLDQVTTNRQGFVTAVKMALIKSGSFTMDLLYERRVGGPSDDAFYGVVRCKLAFFFHFDGSRQPQTVPVTPAMPQTTATRPENRSFVELSRVDQSGLFWSPRAANEISRRISEHRERKTNETPTGVSRGSRPDEGPLLLELVLRVDQLTRVSAEMRHWLRSLAPTNAFRLVQLASLVELMLHCIQTASSSSLTSLMSSSISTYNESINQLVQDASVGRSSSQLHGLTGILRELCSLPQEPLDTFSLDYLYQSLQRSQDTITWLASAAVRDFCLLVEHTATNTGEEAVGTAMADLRADISAAIEQRRFPPAIVAESVFAQYLVETRLDLALERALVSTVASGLPPNPFVSFCTHLRVFARQFLDATEQREAAVSTTGRPPARPAIGGLFAMDIASAPIGHHRVAALVAANERVLGSISAKRVLAIHQFLTNSQVYRTAAYHPSKATYSIRVVTSLIVDDPLLTVEAEKCDGLLFQSVEVVEHVVIEGKELVQALQFFADAVHRDVSRLLERAPVEMQLIGPSGDIVTAVELHDLQMFQQLIMEATPKQCMLQIVFPPVVKVDQAPTEPIVRVVTKKYIFRHKSTEPNSDGLGNCISETFQRRLQTFGVGFDVEAAHFAWELTQTPGAEEKDWAARAEYTPRAHRRNDALLLNHLHRIGLSPDLHPQKVAMHSPSSGLLLYLLDVERALEWLLNRLVFQQQTSLTPRSEAASLANDSKMLLIRIVSTLERQVVPFAVAMGMVDGHRVLDTIFSVRSFCGDTSSSDSDQAVITAERLTRRLWTLVLLVRFSAQADT